MLNSKVATKFLDTFAPLNVIKCFLLLKPTKLWYNFSLPCLEKPKKFWFIECINVTGAFAWFCLKNTCNYLKYDLLALVQGTRFSYKDFSWNEMNVCIHLKYVLGFFYLSTDAFVTRNYYVIFWMLDKIAVGPHTWITGESKQSFRRGTKVKSARALGKHNCCE